MTFLTLLEYPLKPLEKRCIDKKLKTQKRLKKISNVVIATVIFVQHQMVLASTLMWIRETTDVIIENRKTLPN